MITITYLGHALRVARLPRLRLRRCGGVLPMWECTDGVRSGICDTPHNAWERWFAFSVNAQWEAEEDAGEVAGHP